MLEGKGGLKVKVKFFMSITVGLLGGILELFLSEGGAAPPSMVLERLNISWEQVRFTVGTLLVIVEQNRIFREAPFHSW